MFLEGRRAGSFEEVLFGGNGSQLGDKRQRAEELFEDGRQQV